MSSTEKDIPKTREQWRKVLADLPATPEKIPAFFFAHGQPFMESAMGKTRTIPAPLGPDGPLVHFLRDFGPVLLEKYKPKGIVVFSAHFETQNERIGQYSQYVCMELYL